MDPASLALGGASAFLGPIFGLIGQLFSQGDREAAMRLREQVAQQYNISLPPVEHIAAQQAQTNPQDAQEQRSVYNQLLQQGQSGGLTASDRARVDAIQNATSQQERGSRGAILDSMAARGMGGSGTELAAQLSNQQSSADRASHAGIQAAGQANDAARQALVQSAQVASGVRGQDLQEQMYNASQRANTNVFNVGQEQQGFQNQMQLANARSQADTSLANAYEGRGDQTAGMWGGAGQALGQGAGAMAQNLSFQDWLKKQKG